MAKICNLRLSIVSSIKLVQHFPLSKKFTSIRWLNAVIPKVLLGLILLIKVCLKLSITIQAIRGTRLNLNQVLFQAFLLFLFLHQGSVLSAIQVTSYPSQTNYLSQTKKNRRCIPKKKKGAKSGNTNFLSLILKIQN